jgi:hypothetical protein
MHIGIDETGDFSPTSLTRDHFCVAIHPRRRSLDRFRQWESSIGKDNRENGEVKGHLLTNDQLASFVSDVLELDPPIRLRPVLVRPSEETRELIAFSRQATVTGLRAAAQDLATEGNRKPAREAQQCAAWIAALNDSDYLWLIAMSTCVGAALYDLLVDAKAGGYTEELDDLKISVDQRTIRARNLAGRSGVIQAIAWFFRVDSGQAFAAIESVLRDMDDTHPFSRRWRGADRKWRVVPLLESVCNFSARSGELPEIRIADVAAAIFSRGSNRDDPGARALHARCIALVGGSERPLHVRLAQP